MVNFELLKSGLRYLSEIFTICLSHVCANLMKKFLPLLNRPARNGPFLPKFWTALATVIVGISFWKKGTPESKSLGWFLRVSYSFWARDSKFSPNMHFGSYRKPVGSIFQISTSKGDFLGETVFNWRRLLANLNRACSMSCSTFIFTPNQFFYKIKYN